jgi:dTDP-4-amino-4,6-dideoxygalactose transaminase
MIKAKKYKEQYKFLKKEYDAVYKDIMVNGYDLRGPYTKKLENRVKKITGRKYVSATISGTGAIWAAIYALDLFGKKVAVAGYNYDACVSPIIAVCKPVFFDCDENMLIDIDKIPTDCDALMLVNYNGNAVDYDKVRKKFKGKIRVLEQNTRARTMDFLEMFPLSHLVVGNQSEQEELQER